MTLWALYSIFFKFGLLCFGGGYMLVPLLTAELVGPAPLPLRPEEFANLLSIAQATPGPIGINTATYVGYTQQGIPGAVVATLGIVTPALLLVILAVKLLKRYEQSLPIQGFLTGMRPASFGLILAAAVIFAELSIFTNEIPWHEYYSYFSRAEEISTRVGLRPVALLLAAATTVIMLKTRISFLYLLLASAVIGAFFCQ